MKNVLALVHSGLEVTIFTELLYVLIFNNLLLFHNTEIKNLVSRKTSVLVNLMHVQLTLSNVLT